MNILRKTKFRRAVFCFLCIAVVAVSALLPFGEGTAIAEFPLSLRADVSAQGAFLSWNPVPGAREFLLLSADGEVLVSMPSSFRSVDVSGFLQGGGKYSFSLQAVFDDGSALKESVSFDFSAPLPSPSLLSLSGGILSWKPTAGATRYEITLNGVYVGVCSDSLFDLSPLLADSGDFAATVTAFSDDELLLPSAPAILNFSFELPPAAPYAVTLCALPDRLLASWCDTDSSAEAFVCYVYRDGTCTGRFFTEHTFADITPALCGDGSYTLKVKAVRNTEEGSAKTLSFSVVNGEIVL